MIEILKERRKYPRYKAQLPIQYKNVKSLSDPLSGALIKDLGEGGIRFVGNEFLSLARRLVLNISLPAPMRPIKAIAKVSWIRKLPMGDQYEIGNQFLSMTEDDTNHLKNYLGTLQTPAE